MYILKRSIAMLWAVGLVIGHTWRSWRYDERNITQVVREHVDNTRPASLEMSVHTDYKVFLHCRLIQTRVKFSKGWPKSKRFDQLLVYTSFEGSPPAEIVQKFSKPVHFTPLLGRTASLAQQKRAAMEAYVQWIVQQ